MQDLGLLVLRLTVGAFMAGHGAQKMFGWFGGHGLKGTHGMMEQLGMKPGTVWGTAAAISELQGGLLTMLGFLNPLGPLSIAGTMVVAIRKAHWGKPIWNMHGGAEFPLTNMAAATTLALAGPGRYSLDTVFGIKLPRWLAFAMFLGGVGFTYTALQRPELAETALEKVNQLVPTGSTRAVEPGLEVETRQAQPETKPESVATSR